MKLEKIEEIQSFDNKNFVHPWEYMKDVGQKKRMFAEKAMKVILFLFKLKMNGITLNIAQWNSVEKTIGSH